MFNCTKFGLYPHSLLRDGIGTVLPIADIVTSRSKTTSIFKGTIILTFLLFTSPNTISFVAVAFGLYKGRQKLGNSYAEKKRKTFVWYPW